MVAVAIFLLCLGCVFLLIVVHECGHYLAGRIGGISSSDMRIRLFTFPQHVVVRSGDEWIAPMAKNDRYVAVLWEYLETRLKVYLYAAGGLLMETLFTVSVCVAFVFTGYEKIAWMIAAVSLMMSLPWLVIDPIMICRGKITGDISGLWFLSKWPTLLIILTLVGSRVAILWWAW